jgi:hypothetical protein
MTHRPRLSQPTTERRTFESGEVFNIRSALDLDGDRRWITIDAQKGVAT